MIKCMWTEEGLRNLLALLEMVQREHSLLWWNGLQASVASEGLRHRAQSPAPLLNSPSNYCNPTSSSTQSNICKLNKTEWAEQKVAMTDGLIAKARGERHGYKISRCTLKSVNLNFTKPSAGWEGLHGEKGSQRTGRGRRRVMFVYQGDTLEETSLIPW